MRSLIRKLVSTAAGIFLILSTSAAIAQNIPDQKIWTQYCVASPDSTCFDPVDGVVDSVGRDVAELAGNFRFCLQVDTVDSGYAPVRVSLVLDNSRSMCENPGSCSCTGDSTNNCMNNDPENKRVEAAHVFVNSLRVLNPQSEVAVVVFSSDASGYGPLSLETDQNLQQVHSWIDNAGCNKNPGLGTNLGLGLQSGLSLVDKNYNELLPLMTRHIILLTDGAWDDFQTRSPEMILESYSTRYPDRVKPTIHGVFISDSITHVEHHYPWQGCAGSGLVDLSHLQSTAEATGGLYFPGSRPETVIENFQTLLDSVVQSAPQMLSSLKVTNTTNGAISTNGTIRQVGSTPTWETTLKSLPLAFGANVLTVNRVISRPGRTDSIITSNVTIIRSDRYRQALDNGLFIEHCELDDASIKITATPAVQSKNAPVAVNATISNTTNFNLSEVKVRIFTRFPDSENGVLATFHLDGTLVNATSSTTAATGNPVFTASSQLFGSGALTSGNFLYALPVLPDAFTFEAWVKPSSGAGMLIRGTGFEVGVDANSRLYLKNETDTVVTAVVPLDAGVWSHIAIARQGGKIVLFVNGSAVSDAVPFTAQIPAGSVTFSVPNRWSIDEIRISNIGRYKETGTGRTLTIPTIQNPSWTLGTTTSTEPNLTVPTTAWKNGTALDFTFASPVDGTVLVNIFQAPAGSSIGTGWSKNSNPVIIAADQTGPSVRKGTLTPYTTSNRDVSPRDTLLLEFSEPVRCDSLTVDPDVSESIEFFSDNKIVLQIARDARYLDECPATQIITTMRLALPVGLTPDHDSIRLIGRVVDTSGNPPPANNIKGPVVWGEGRGIIITSYQNGPDLLINAKLKDSLGIRITNSKVVTIKPVIPLLAIDTTADTVSYGEATVYDAVGNVMASKLTTVASKQPRTYYTLWNGRNSNGRRVGPGAYYIHFSFRYINGREGSDGKKFLITWR